MLQLEVTSTPVQRLSGCLEWKKLHLANRNPHLKEDVLVSLLPQSHKAIFNLHAAIKVPLSLQWTMDPSGPNCSFFFRKLLGFELRM